MIPLFHEVDLALICSRELEGIAGSITCGHQAGARGGKPWPFDDVTALSLPNLVGEPVDQSQHVVGAERGLPELLVAIDPELPKIDVGEQAAPPGIMEHVGARVPNPRLPNSRIEVSPIGGALGSVKVPNWTEGEFSVSRFIKIRAQPQGIDVKRHRIEDVMIDPGVHVDELAVTDRRIGVIGSGEGRAEGVQVVLEIGQLRLLLRGSNVSVLWFKTIDGLPGRVKGRGPRGIAVDAHQVAAGDGGRCFVAELELVDVHAILVDLDFFLQHVGAVVIGAIERPASGVPDDLDKPGPRGVAAGLVAQLVCHRIMDLNRVKIVDRVKHEIVF